MLWYKELGYKTNPLSIKPTEDNGLIGYEKIIQRLIYQIKIGNVIFLEGDYGTGKSSILRYIKKSFKDNILYFNCSANKDLRTNIMKKRSAIRKMFFMKPKKLILLMDETHLANPRNFDFLYEFYIMDRVKSIVFAGTDFKGVHFNKAFKSDTKKYTLNEVKNNLAIEIIKNRMPEQKMLSTVLAKKMFLLSDKNPRLYLENVEDLFRRAHTLGKKKILKKDIDEFFEKK